MAPAVKHSRVAGEVVCALRDARIDGARSIIFEDLMQPAGLTGDVDVGDAGVDERGVGVRWIKKAVSNQFVERFRFAKAVEDCVFACRDLGGEGGQLATEDLTIFDDTDVME